MKKLLMLVLAVAALVGCDCKNCVKQTDMKAVSPDGRNAIRIYACEKGLAYEVARDGIVVVGKSPIGMKIDGKLVAEGAKVKSTTIRALSGIEATPVYKKDLIDLAGCENFIDFGDWGVRLVARNDGVAYRFETKLPGTVTVDCERAEVVVPDSAAKCWANRTGVFGCEESRPVSTTAGELKTGDNGQGGWRGTKMIYLPFAFSVGGKYVAVTESDVRDYPVWNLVSTEAPREGGTCFGSLFEGAPKKTQRVGGWGETKLEKGGRWVSIEEHEDFLVRTSGTRTFPWRTFVLADEPVKFCEADIVRALAPAQDEGSDFSWVKPGKVAWDWWNCFDNADPKTAPNGGCTTKTYERFIDFAQKTGVEYVIFDEGWSESLNIWKFHPEVDVPHLIRYANERGVGIVLWMAWAQVYGEEDRVAEHFSKLGAKGFKVDFMDRGDAEVSHFLEKFAAACAKHGMLVDYHGVSRPNGLQRRYPNVINFEGIHGLEQSKWHDGNDVEMMFNDVAAFFLRLTAGPMDYTPGAMLNFAVGSGYKGNNRYPGSVGTRCRQMAMMALYEAPLQMLCDSPTNYEKNMECFSFMAKTPVVWAKTVGVTGTPDSAAVVARQAKDGSWYVAGINTSEPLVADFGLDFLGEGEWKAEIFRDADDADKNGTSYIHETKDARAGDHLRMRMAPGGGFVMKLMR